MISKNLWIRNILAIVRKIADPEYQDRAWVKCEIHWPCSFEELNCQLFDDCFIRDFLEKDADKFNLSKEQILSLKTFVDAFDELGYKPEIYFPQLPRKVDEVKLLSNPEWHRVQKLANYVLQAFGIIKYEIEDKEWWLPYIINAIESFANIREQKSKWNDERAFYSTPEDMHDHLFKDNDFDIFMDTFTEKFGCNEFQILALNRLRSVLKNTFFPNPVNLTKLLKNPEWKNIQTLAYNVLVTFNVQKRVSFSTFWSQELQNRYNRLMFYFRNWIYQRRIKKELNT